LASGIDLRVSNSDSSWHKCKKIAGRHTTADGIGAKRAQVVTQQLMA